MHHFHKPSTNSTVSIVNSCFIDMVATLHLDPSFRWLKVDEISPLNQSIIAIQRKQNFSKESKHHQNSMEVFLEALYVCYGDESFPWCRLVKILILKLSEFLRPCDLIVSCLVHCLYQLKISLHAWHACCPAFFPNWKLSLMEPFEKPFTGLWLYGSNSFP